MIRTRKWRKPLVLVGVTCTSVLFGMVVFQRVLSSKSHHLTSHVAPLHSPSPSLSLSKYCSTCNSSVYKRLKKFESTKLFKDSVVKRLDVVFLGSNSPIEDRFVVGTSEGLGATFLSMIDGHKGTLCSQYLQENMLQHVSAYFAKEHGQKDDMRVVLDMDLVTKGLSDNEVITHRDNVGESVLTSEVVMEGLKKSLAGLDDKMSQTGLDAVKALLAGKPLTGELRSQIETAVHGACALTTMLRRNEIFVANTGDCRAVVGREGVGPQHRWKPLPLSVDQNAQNADEVNRLLAAHPGEVGTVIANGRVLGSLMPFRTFGDVDLKWERQYLTKIAVMVPLDVYKTPPYVIAEPVLTQHKFTPADKFLVLATDGLWERLSNQQVVDIVGGAVAHERERRGLGSSADSASCCSINAATELLWHSLGGTEGNVSDLLAVDPQLSRYFRDDITIMVAYLGGED